MSLPIEERVSASGAAGQDGDPPVLADPDGQFARNFNRRHFRFTHGLKGHPLFELANLIALAKRPLHVEAYWSNGKVGPADSWGSNPAPRLSLVDTLANIGDNNSLVILKQIAHDPVHGPVLQDFLARVASLLGEQICQDVVAGETTILISSPNRLTSYHMDPGCNFLMQVAGNKTLWVYDHTDPTLVSHEEIEQFYMGNHNSIVYRESRQCDAAAYELHAGDGVHIPFFAPHWARNHDNISIALSVYYELRPMLAEKRIYQLNGLLRKLGATPTPPGISPSRDRLKLAAANGVVAAYRLIRRKRAHPVWTPRLASQRHGKRAPVDRSIAR
ncbi:MAG: cupin-like domain-containing protein [Methylocella sp.]